MLPKALYNFFQNKGLVNKVSKALLAKAGCKAREERFNCIFDIQERVQELQINQQLASAFTVYSIVFEIQPYYGCITVRIIVLLAFAVRIKLI